MRQFIVFILTMLLIAGTAGAVSLKRGGDRVSPIPGLGLDGFGDETTVEFLKKLPSLVALPALPRLYFSADSTGYPAGSDSNPCTTKDPCLSLGYAEELSKNGNVILVFDALDTWNTSGDLGSGGKTFTLGASDAACGNERGLCIAWIGSDPSGFTKPTFNCDGLGGSTDFGFMFQDSRSSREGWWVFSNLTLTQCPPTTAVSQDIFRLDGTGSQVLVHNVVGVEIQGFSNQYFTSHTTATSATTTAQFIVLNGECDTIESTGNSAECLRSAGDFDIIVIGGSWTNSDDPGDATTTVIQVGGAGGTFPQTTATIIGAQVTNQATLTSTKSAFGIQFSNAANETNTSWVSHTSIAGFTSAGGTGSAAFSSSVGAITGVVMDATLYKIASSNNQIFYTNSNIPSGNTLTMVGDCILIDGSDEKIINTSLANTCPQIDLKFNGMIYDEDDATTPYSIEGDKTADTADEFETDTTTEGCLNNPWEFNGTEVSTDQFGGNSDLAICQASDCLNACTTPKVHTFFNGMYIPAFVLGTEVLGFSFSGTSNAGP